MVNCTDKYTPSGMSSSTDRLDFNPINIHPGNVMGFLQSHVLPAGTAVVTFIDAVSITHVSTADILAGLAIDSGGTVSAWTDNEPERKPGQPASHLHEYVWRFNRGVWIAPSVASALGIAWGIWRHGLNPLVWIAVFWFASPSILPLLLVNRPRETLLSETILMMVSLPCALILLGICGTAALVHDSNGYGGAFFSACIWMVSFVITCVVLGIDSLCTRLSERSEGGGYTDD